ncbi:TIGR02597 family protein [Oleiharenicola lentus]|uniref:TIGR02597 family protein n=1 Tax=Oleiharenicola lentus TaxID=2508720 RepID=UPI003F6747A2
MKLSRLRFLLLTLALGPLAAFAVPSDPVGVFKLRLQGNSDTTVSLPLLRPALAEGALASRTGSTFTLTVDVPALPVGGAFVLVMNGSLEGTVLPITDVNGRTVTIAAGAIDLSALHTETVQGPALGDTVAVVPYWTLDTVFPGGSGVNISTSALTRATEIFFYNNTTAGKNRSVSPAFFYFSGNTSKPAGWYQVGDNTGLKGSQRLDPHNYVIVRQNVATETSLAVAGAVQMAGFRVPLALLAADTDQDHFLGLPCAVPMTLSASRLVASGAFAVSTSAVTRADELYVFNNAMVAKNKSPSAPYFYFAGNAQKIAGWYQVGASVPDTSFTLKPGEGFIIRKRQAATIRTDLWDALPVYLQ